MPPVDTIGGGGEGGGGDNGLAGGVMGWWVFVRIIVREAVIIG